MANDAQLERLKSEQDRTYARKQAAYEAQQRAWDRRSSVRDDMNRAYDTKQHAYDQQDASWQEYQRVRSYNGPRIDSLNSQQETAYQNMVRAYENSRAAYDRRDGASASSLAADGRRYKEESQGYVAERRRLVEEIRSAKTGTSHSSRRSNAQKATSMMPSEGSTRQKPNTNEHRPTSDRPRQTSTRLQARSKQGSSSLNRRTKNARMTSALSPKRPVFRINIETTCSSRKIQTAIPIFTSVELVSRMAPDMVTTS